MLWAAQCTHWFNMPLKYRRPLSKGTDTYLGTICVACFEPTDDVDMASFSWAGKNAMETRDLVSTSSGMWRHFWARECRTMLKGHLVHENQ